jgi:hypothetical protein
MDPDPLQKNQPAPPVITASTYVLRAEVGA